METYEELVERYMKCDKKTLAEMLALRDLPYVPKAPINEPYQPQPWHFPPYIPNDYWPYWPQVWCTTKTIDDFES